MAKEKKDLEKEYGGSELDGPGRVDKDPKRTQKVDRYDWSGNPIEKSYLPRGRK